MRVSIKCILFLLFGGLLEGCLPKGEIKRQMKCKLVNNSGVNVRQATIYFFHFEAPSYVGDKIVVKGFSNTESVEVRYNLEHVEGFWELSTKVKVELDDASGKTLELQLPSIDFRRLSSDWKVIIQKDTLLRSYVRK